MSEATKLKLKSHSEAIRAIILKASGHQELYTFDILLDPQVKGRPRFTSSGHVYTPEKTRFYEQTLGQHLRIDFKRSIFTRPVTLYVDFYFAMPKYKKVMAATPNGDLDNYLKAFKDAANTILYHDDRQVNLVIAAKNWATTAKVVATIHETFIYEENKAV
jgi:Holliday junction resolvase RusA-like endonuclease